MREKLPEWRTPSAAFWLQLLETEALLAAGDLEAALESARKADAYPLGRRDPAASSALWARLHEARGELDEAIAAYAEILEPPHLTLSEGPTRMPQDEWPVLEIPALFDQARLLDAAGNATAAKRRYREFLSHWGEADVELPSVAEARRRLMELGS